MYSGNRLSKKGNNKPDEEMDVSSDMQILSVVEEPNEEDEVMPLAVVTAQASQVSLGGKGNLQQSGNAQPQMKYQLKKNLETDEEMELTTDMPLLPIKEESEDELQELSTEWTSGSSSCCCSHSSCSCSCSSSSSSSSPPSPTPSPFP